MLDDWTKIFYPCAMEMHTVALIVKELQVAILIFSETNFFRRVDPQQL